MPAACFPGPDASFPPLPGGVAAGAGGAGCASGCALRGGRAGRGDGGSGGVRARGAAAPGLRGLALVGGTGPEPEAPHAGGLRADRRRGGGPGPARRGDALAARAGAGGDGPGDLPKPGDGAGDAGGGRSGGAAVGLRREAGRGGSRAGRAGGRAPPHGVRGVEDVHQAQDPRPSQRCGVMAKPLQRTASNEAGHRRIEIVHESLLTHWPRLVRWRTQDADGAQLRDQLRQAAHLWDERGRPDDLLWTGTSYLDYRAGGLATRAGCRLSKRSSRSR